MKKRIITISREFGSGGRTIGRLTAEKLGIACYDHELIGKVAEESGFAEGFIKECGESAGHGNWFMNAFAGRNTSGGLLMPQDQLWLVQQQVIQKLAEKEPCVIVGRCADHILRDRKDVLSAFIYAEIKKRAERILKVYGETEDAPEKRIRDKDKRRAAYYEFYTDRKWGRAQNYDIGLNAGELGIDTCVDILTGLYQKAD